MPVDANPSAAAFARYVDGLLAGNASHPTEWGRFIATHHANERMEQARRHVVRLIAIRHGGNPRRLSVAERAELDGLVAPLRTREP